MRFVHTADWHLGRPFTGLGSKGSVLRDAQMVTASRVIDVALSEDVDFVVISGDLFDSNEVSGRLVRKTTSLLAGLAPVPALVLPGTHDVLDEGSIYRRREIDEVDNIFVFGIDGTSVEVDGAVVHGRANDTKQGGVRPLRDLKRDTKATANVAVVHASIEIPGKSNPEDYLVTPDDIAKSKMDYVAMGHWHKRGDYSSGGVAAWYSGAPETLKFSEANGAGDVLLVEIHNRKAAVEPRHVGQFTWLEKTVDVAKFPPCGPLEAEILKSAGKDVLLKVRLRGVVPKDSKIDPTEMEQSLSEEFFHIQIDASGIGYPLEGLEGMFPKGTMGAIYVRQLKGQIKKAKTKEETALLEEALHRGAGFISGSQEVV